MNWIWTEQYVTLVMEMDIQKSSTILTIAYVVLFFSVVCIVWGFDGTGKGGWSRGVLCSSHLSHIRSAAPTVCSLALAIHSWLRLRVQPCSSSSKMFHAATQPKFVVQFSSQQEITLLGKANQCICVIYQKHV